MNKVDPAAHAAIDGIRQSYTQQNIRAAKLGFGRKTAVLVVYFQHLYTRGPFTAAGRTGRGRA